MNILDAVFRNNKTYTATVLSNTGSMSNGIQGPKTWTRGTSFECLFWRSGMSGTIFSQMFKSDVSAYLVARPSDVDKTDLPAGCRVKLETQEEGTYSGTVSGNHTTGDTTIEVIMPVAEFALIKVNDILKIGTVEYTIVSAAGSTPQIITITPGIAGNVATTTAVIVQPVTVINTYEVIYADDVAGQGQVLNVSLKEI
jgi:hypothetical protein